MQAPQNYLNPVAQAPQNYLNTVATEESRKQKLYELDVRLHNQEVYNKDTVQVDLNRLINGWNAIEARLGAIEARLGALESVGEEAPTAGGRRTRGKLRARSRVKSRKKRRRKRRKSRRRKRRRKNLKKRTKRRR